MLTGILCAVLVATAFGWYYATEKLDKILFGFIMVGAILIIPLVQMIP